MSTLPILIAPEATSTFDYSSLDNAVAIEARATADRIRKRIESSYLDTGRDLLAIKDKLKHGRFGKWLSAEFGMTERTAQNLMNAAKYASGKPETVSHLPAKAVYKLAAPSTPEDVRDEIEQRVIKGERPSMREIEDRIAQARDAQAREAVMTRELKSKTEVDLKAFGRRENDWAARERRASEEAERLVAERQKAAQEAMELLRERLGPDLPRFEHLCRQAGGTLALLGELITDTIPVIAEVEPVSIDEAASEARQGIAEEALHEADHDFSEDVVVGAASGFFDEVAAGTGHGLFAEGVHEADDDFTNEVVVEPDYGFTAEHFDDPVVEDSHAEIVAEKVHPNPAELTELDLDDAA